MIFYILDFNIRITEPGTKMPEIMLKTLFFLVVAKLFCIFAPGDLSKSEMQIE